LKVFAIVPVKPFESAKSRLGTLLNKYERERLSKLLLKRTVSVLKRSSRISAIVLVSPDLGVEKIAHMHGVTFLKERLQDGVNSAVKLAEKYCSQAGAEATLVLPLDLPLLLPEDIDTVCNVALTTASCIILCPSYKLDGSNLMLRKPSNIIQTSYDSNSYIMHALEGARKNIKTSILFIRRVMVDIDTKQDITEFLTSNEADEQIALYLKGILDKKGLYIA
jgi:2-phospho-L-lactate guanylyltransferase